MTTAPIEIDDYTRRGHENFRRVTKLKCGDGKVRTFSQWLEWMRTWDPLTAPQDMRPTATKKAPSPPGRTGPSKTAVAKKTAPNQ